MRSALESAVRKEVLAHDPSIALAQDHRATSLPLHPLRLVAHHVAHEGGIGADLARRRQAEALLRPALGFHLRHFFPFRPSAMEICDGWACLLAAPPASGVPPYSGPAQDLQGSELRPRERPCRSAPGPRSRNRPGPTPVR